ncbi:MAG: DRTGG domain-containing protein [Bacteroidales bacterium]|jgi:predicted transcriptional regulator|nr:DRTGG domain-containing protein [Bacteroidales bacterium]MCI2121399.1 DRTGG domain-containing protein [Bacteroidales bacterium]MCI2145482.1 DRTGG domain-containing protein [Bacteroidales bacterium]
MKLSEIVRLTGGTVVCGERHIDENVDYAFASDLMSDVLTLRITDFLLITGLANVQAMRTAEMSDLKYLLFARGKQVTDDMVELADENGIMIISTPYSVFRTSGILYGAGLKPVY